MEILQKNINILYSEEELRKGIEQLAKKLNDLYAGEEIYLICVLRGAVFFAVDLAKYLTMPVKMEFIKLSSYGASMTSSGKINALDVSLPDLNGKNVLVVEDIIDTGYTAKFLIDLLHSQYNMKSLKFVPLLDKKSKRKVDMNPDFFVFEVDDKFIVGYGMDYNEHYRNLPYIGYVNID